MQSMLYICKPLTPSKNEEEPPFLGETAKHHYQQEVGHDAFTQHPAVRSQEEVLQHGRDKLAGNLKYVLVKQLSCLNISRHTSLSNSNSFPKHRLQYPTFYVLCSITNSISITKYKCEVKKIHR